MSGFNVSVIVLDLEHTYNIESCTEMNKINDLTAHGWKIHSSQVTSTERGSPKAVVFTLVRNLNLNVME